ncbi:MAG: cysteine desulfurase [Deltaproteobacteria bacterium]|nr:cysteine desulfurase [Deltaproteobacteria bacterium]
MPTARVYLDWNATTPPLPEALDAMRDAGATAWGNPSSIHGDGRAARSVVEDARAAVGELTGFDPRDVTLTAGGTEANNLAVRAAFAGPPSGKPRWLLTSRLEHPSIAKVAAALEREGLARVRHVGVTRSGILDMEDLDRAIDAIVRSGEEIGLVTVQAVNNETGIVQPFGEVIDRAHAAKARVHVDAVQGWGKVDTSPVAKADSASLAIHKLRGPKGIGALLTRASFVIPPILLGGSQERGIRPGTVDAVLASGLRVAALHARDGRERNARIAPLRDRLEAALLALDAPGGRARPVGDPSRRVGHVSQLVWPGWVGAELVAALDLEGISVSSGAACSAGTVEPSPVLHAMLGDDGATSGVRCSLGELTTTDDVDRAIAAFTRVVARGHAPRA